MSSPTAMVQRHKSWLSSPSVRWLLAIHSFALALPILALVGFLFWNVAANERVKLEGGALDTAQIIAQSVDREIAALRSALDVLSTSANLRRGDLPAFYEQAKEVERRLGFSLVLRDPSGQQLLNTRRPLGSDLPRVNLPVDERARASKRPEISDLFVGNVAGVPLFTVTAPVLRDDEVAYFLNVSVEVDRLRAIIQEAKPPANWTVAIIDRQGIIMARNKQHAEFVGRPATRDLIENTTGDRGTWDGTTADGRQVLGAYHSVPQSGWRVAVGVARADLIAPLRHLLWLFSGLIVVILVLSALLAVVMGRRITGPIQALASQASALGRSEHVEVLSTGLLEVDSVSRELAGAADSLREEARRLDTLNQVGAALAAELDLDRLVQAVIDAATRITGAAYGAFFERVPAGHEGNDAEVWRLFSLSGAPREAFTRFGLPRATNLFGPTFRAEGVVRSHDVTVDHRYGLYGGMPEGHLPVRSYLAVAVLSRSGETLGALLFGHPEAGLFGEREERLALGLAGQAAIALDNARLFAAAQAELEQRRRAEVALAAAQEHAEAQAAERAAILTQLAEGVIVTDAAGQIVFVNEAAASLHGVARLDIAPDGYSEAYHLFTMDGRPYPFEELPLARAVLRGETVTDERWRIRRPDGSEILAIGSAGPVLAPDGTRIGSVLTLRDDTRREASEQALRRLNEVLAEQAAELKESNEEIQRYAYIVSHDLRAPLVNVMGFTSELEAVQEEIRRELKDSSRRDAIERDMTESLTFIKAAIMKMEGLIAAILRLSREGRRTLRPEPLVMTDVIQGLADAIRHQTGAVGAEIIVAPDLPDLIADRLAVEQIFGNLLDNAVKYLEPSRPGRIEVVGQAAGSRLVYRVIDNGRGIAPGDHARVFELFRRAGPQDRPGEGIGLAHVKALVRSLGGRIELSSELGQGATFTVALPSTPALAGSSSSSDPVANAAA